MSDTVVQEEGSVPRVGIRARVLPPLYYPALCTPPADAAAAHFMLPDAAVREAGRTAWAQHRCRRAGLDTQEDPGLPSCREEREVLVREATRARDKKERCLDSCRATEPYTGLRPDVGRGSPDTRFTVG